MGVCFQQIKGDGPPMNSNEELNLASGWIWVVLRRDPVPTPADWHMQGFAADESLALEMCTDETYLIGPLPFNTALPHDRIEWAGSYYPHKRK